MEIEYACGERAQRSAAVAQLPARGGRSRRSRSRCAQRAPAHRRPPKATTRIVMSGSDVMSGRGGRASLAREGRQAVEGRCLIPTHRAEGRRCLHIHQGISKQWAVEASRRDALCKSLHHLRLACTSPATACPASASPWPLPSQAYSRLRNSRQCAPETPPWQHEASTRALNTPHNTDGGRRS